MLRGTVVELRSVVGSPNVGDITFQHADHPHELDRLYAKSPHQLVGSSILSIHPLNTYHRLQAVLISTECSFTVYVCLDI